jgi:hypothetical protein
MKGGDGAVVTAKMDVGAAATSLIWCSTPSGHGNGLRPWIQNNGRRTAYEPLNLTLDLEYAHVSGHPRNPVSNRRAGCTIWSTFQAALFLWNRGA